MTGVARVGRRLFYPAAICGGFGMLVACTESPPPPTPRSVAVVSTPPMPSLPSPPQRRAFPVPARKPSPPPPTVAPDATTAVAMATPEAGPPETAMPAPPQPTAPQPSALIGLDEPAATRLLGAASEHSAEPPATVWRYRNAICELDLFFYLDLRSGKMRTLRYAFKGDAASPDGQQGCLRSLVVARGS